LYSVARFNLRVAARRFLYPADSRPLELRVMLRCFVLLDVYLIVYWFVSLNSIFATQPTTLLENRL